MLALTIYTLNIKYSYKYFFFLNNNYLLQYKLKNIKYNTKYFHILIYFFLLNLKFIRTNI